MAFIWNARHQGLISHYGTKLFTSCDICGRCDLWARRVFKSIQTLFLLGKGKCNSILVVYWYETHPKCKWPGFDSLLGHLTFNPLRYPLFSSPLSSIVSTYIIYDLFLLALNCYKTADVIFISFHRPLCGWACRKFLPLMAQSTHV